MNTKNTQPEGTHDKRQPADSQNDASGPPSLAAGDDWNSEPQAPVLPPSGASEPLWQCVQDALDDLTSELDYGYIIGGGWECSVCGRKSSAPENITHEEGCIARSMDRLVQALRILRQGGAVAPAPSDTSDERDAGLWNLEPPAANERRISVSRPLGEQEERH